MYATNQVKTITIDNRARPPTAVGRSSVKVNKNAILFDTVLRSNSSLAISERANQYCNIVNQQATRININNTSNAQDFQTKHIKLLISNNGNKNDSPTDVAEDRELYLSTLLDEYQASLNEKSCDNINCHRFKLLSYRISQTLLERIGNLSNNDGELRKENKDISQISLNRHPSLRNPSNSCEISVSNTTYNMNNLDSLHNLVVEKNKRIKELEKLVEDQKRLRLQDATQVEEKASRIKEWVANKLKELENQNRQLRDQNRKQKEAVESLSTKLSTMSPISSPRKVNSNSDSVHFIDQSSPIETIDVDESLKTRRPQLKKTFLTASSSSEDENQNLKNSSPCRSMTSRYVTQVQTNEKIFKNAPPDYDERDRNESPVYDSVALDQTYRKNTNQQDHQRVINKEEALPPPPPLHQSDRWELRLYSLADQTFSSILKQDEKIDDICNKSDSLDSISDKDATISRKSSSSVKNDLISLMKPSFTTIDGDNVVESVNFDSQVGERTQYGLNIRPKPSNCRHSSDQSSQSSLKLGNGCKELIDSHEIASRPTVSSVFDSPMRSRSGKDSILRTQSVKRNPAPEKLYDFISSDLVKRGYLTKTGALKNHSRWFVLKDFYLLSYKSESDETAKATPNMKLRLDLNCQVQPINQSNESTFAFKLSYPDKTIQLFADTALVRDEWIGILTVAINFSDMEPDSLTKNNAACEGIMSVTRHGHTKRCYATLINHVLFFLKSFTDPSPTCYISVKGSKIREITDIHDYDLDEQEQLKQVSSIKDCSLAIYPKYSLIPDPIYITFESQTETDRWFHFLSAASRVDQSYGTQFERTLTRLMVDNSVRLRKNEDALLNSPDVNRCFWWENPVMLYSDRPISEPLTTLHNENLKIEALEMFKSILLFIQVPMEPIAIDYHVCLLQNCLSRFLKFPELRNEYFAQLIKQFTYILHRCNRKLSNSSSECSSIEEKTSSSLSSSISECQFITDPQVLNAIGGTRGIKIETNSTLSQLNSLKDKNELSQRPGAPPNQSEILQVMQILAVSVSLNLPRGRLRWWLGDYLRKFARQDTNVGKYALYTLQSIDRTLANGPRDNIPSRTEIMSILLRNPYNHSSPHSLPVNFSDGTYLVLEADGSTTIEEFMDSMCKKTDIRVSALSDFYLFSDDPSGSKDLHILEPERKVLDIVGWWEQAFRRHNSGRYENTKVIKLMCKKRLVLRAENGETHQERLLILHQVNQEIVSQKLPLSEDLCLEFCALMAQLTFGDFDKSKDPKIFRCIMEKITNSFLPIKSSQSLSPRHSDFRNGINSQIIERWRQLSGRSAQDCIRVYLNCIRRLKFSE